MDSPDTAKRVLIVDRDPASMERLRQALCEAGLAVRILEHETGALEAVTDSPPHLAIVDWNGAVGSTLEFIRELLSARAPHTPRLIIASALSEEQDVVRALSLGADDYISKPFSVREAVARVFAVLRTTSRRPERRALVFDELVLDASSNRVIARGCSMHLRGAEYRLLEFLMGHPGRTFNRAELLLEVWGCDHRVDERTVDVNVRRLRKTLSEPGYETYIHTVRGFGYRFMRPGG